jgi:hypothetical protein
VRSDVASTSRQHILIAATTADDRKEH